MLNMTESSRMLLHSPTLGLNYGEFQPPPALRERAARRQLNAQVLGTYLELLPPS